jgi:hypothetical protein
VITNGVGSAIAGVAIQINAITIISIFILFYRLLFDLKFFYMHNGAGCFLLMWEWKKIKRRA